MALHMIHENGYSYYIERVENNVRYVHCSWRIRNQCFAQGIKVADQPLNLTIDQNHRIGQIYRDRIYFRNESRQAAATSFLPVREIYNDLSTRNPEEALILPFNTVSRTMRDIQNRIRLPIVNTSGELINTLYNRNFASLRQYDRKHSIQFFNVSNDAMVISVPRLMSLLSFNTLYISSTTRSVPAINNTRLLTYVLAEFRHHVFPIAFILWARRNDEICVNVVNILTQLTQPNVIIAIYSDFDLVPYLANAFVESRVTATYDSYCHILYQRALDLDVQPHLNNHDLFLRNCMNIILLPENLIQNTFNEIINNFNAPELEDFSNYVRDEWIK
ncbi:uncharacterized protein LOC130673880 [Microplitis mediator]|uniref:uncharacterized protein LOC130673880 n=1 Tax=Microplitis mediator TaxID=375433 RepID=UPI00255506E9|nr:uncharacterized protein LOC130673880 [Microplitis mediator]